MEPHMIYPRAMIYSSENHVEFRDYDSSFIHPFDMPKVARALSKIKDRTFINRNKNTDHVIEGYKSSPKYFRVEIIERNKKYGCMVPMPLDSDIGYPKPNKCILAFKKKLEYITIYTYVLLWIKR